MSVIVVAEANNLVNFLVFCEMTKLIPGLISDLCVLKDSSFLSEFSHSTGESKNKY